MNATNYANCIGFAKLISDGVQLVLHEILSDKSTFLSGISSATS